MSLSVLLAMGGLSVGGVIIEKILGKLGKVDEANMVGTVTTATLVSTVVGSILTAFGELKKLGK